MVNARPAPPRSSDAYSWGNFKINSDRITCATENIQAKEDGSQVALSFADWQRVLAVQMLLARYLRAVAEPDSLGE